MVSAGISISSEESASIKVGMMNATMSTMMPTAMNMSMTG